MEIPEIPNYAVKKQIGIGRHGSVWMALDADQHPVAIKVYEEGLDLTPLKSMADRLSLEPTQYGAALLLHQDLECTPSHSVTELLADPETLDSWSLEERSPELSENPSEVWDFLRSLLKALAWLHRHPLPHGNLKPSNIFLTQDGGVRLTDHLLSGIGSKGICSDGLFYMPPEQLRHPESLSKGAAYSWDVYAFGVEAFRLLTGQFPRLHDHFNEALQQGTDHQLEIQADPSRLARDLEQSDRPAWPLPLAQQTDPRLKFIPPCLELHPSKRPANANELLARFDALNSPEVVARERYGAQRRARRLWKRATLGLVGASLAVAALATWAWRSESNRFDQLLTKRSSTAAQLADELTAARNTAENAQQKLKLREEALLRQLSETELAEIRFRSRFAELGELNQNLFDYAMGNQAGSSHFLDDKARRASLREDIRELRSRLGNRPDDSLASRRLLWYLTQLDYQDEKWQAAAEGLEKALAPPDLWPENASAKVIPWRQLAEARLKLGDPNEAKEALSRSFTSLKGTAPDSEWYADQLGRNHILNAEIAAQLGDKDAEIRHTKAALSAFASAPAGHGSLVYFRRRYLDLAELHGMQLEARGELDALTELRQKALETLNQTLETETDGELLFRLGQTQLALAKSALRTGQSSDVKAQQDALQKTSARLRKVNGFDRHAAMLNAESLLINAESSWDQGQQSQALASLTKAKTLAQAARSPQLKPQQQFLMARIAWSQLLFSQSEPSATAIQQLSENLKQQSDAAPATMQRQITAFRAAMLSDASALLSLSQPEQATQFATSALELWTALLTQFPKQSDYQAMADWTRETLERLND